MIIDHKERISFFKLDCWYYFLITKNFGLFFEFGELNAIGHSIREVASHSQHKYLPTGKSQAMCCVVSGLLIFYFILFIYLFGN